MDYGEAVSLRGRLLAPRNSAAVPFADILARRGIRSEMRYPRLRDRGPASTGWLGWVVPVRQHLEAGINASLPEPEAALLVAITLGARSASLGDLTPVLVATGLIHIIAISGIKVALVAGTLFELCRRLRRRTIALVTPLIGLAVYVLLTGATASGLRSALMWSMVFLADYLGRRTVALVSLGFVAALMVGFDPSLPWDIGFQLSTVGTFAIVAFASPLSDRFRLLISPFREAFFVTLAAQIGTLPIVAIGFHLLSGSGPLANTLVLPLLSLLIILGFVLGAFSGVAFIAWPVGAAAYALLHGAIALVDVLARIPATWPVSALPPEVVVVYYLVVGGLAGLVFHRTGWAPVSHPISRSREFSLALLVAASALTVTRVQAGDAGATDLHWLGSGHSILLQSRSRVALIDGSARPLGLLTALGRALPYDRRTVDLVLVTDARSGNVSGLEAVLQHYHIGEVLDTGAQYPSATYARWRAELRSRRIPVYALRTGVAVRLGDAQIEALGPDALYPQPQDAAGMLRVTLPGHSFLLATAASRRELTEAVFRPVHMRSDVLVIDGRQGVPRSFLAAVRPCLLYSRARLRADIRSAPLVGAQSLASPPAQACR